jgi:hypothetical protein
MVRHVIAQQHAAGRSDGDGESPDGRPRLTLLDGNGAPQPRIELAWAGDGERLWPAWRGLPDWENRALEQFGDDLGGHLLVLWALYTFSGPDVQGLLNDMVDDDLQPTFGNSLVADMMCIAFALGAGWARTGGVAEPPPPERIRTRG